ncbi:hypothetical protein GE061_000132 [Apolygus lucorum]|uniref:Ig-like domain-containing protein n=1 Tax=Apolygus lucorum TaxID=248454 RepID=A0A8S9Y3I0_APOLU|nr:hypothetical protein GE061_000132 [Apolygus lucorum]
MENALKFVLLCVVVAVTSGADEVPVVNAEYDFGNTRVLEYRISNTLRCNASNAKGPPLPFAWLKDDMELENSLKYRIANNQLTILRTSEEDIARYTCVLIKENKAYATRKDIQTLGKPTAKIVSQGTFIQGQKVRLECVTQGKPTPTIHWRFGNETLKASNGRIKLSENEKKIPNAVLTIESAEMSDRGDYYCYASNTATKELNITVETSSYVRVKDKLAALWPFIGICAEVIVLCAIIFVYERKRNKAEMDESDTDISPDQKNTPDHGKDSVRQRK